MSSIVDLESELLLLTLSLYNNPALPRNIVQIFVDNVINFTNVTFRNYVNQHLNFVSSNIDKQIVYQIQSIFDTSKAIFDKFATEHLRFSLYQEKGLMIQPIECEIGFKITNKVVNNVVSLEREKVILEYIPLKWSLKLLLELPGMFQLLKSYMNDLEMDSDITSNFIQGKLWKQMREKFEKGKFFVPLIIYYDDFETGNALGSHAGKQKLGAVYCQIPCFPSYITSQLKSILLVSLFHANDRKKYGNKVFNKLISELNEINLNGIDIVVDNEVFKVYFQLALITGDNLGLNEILGFTSNFNSGCPCRVCRATIEQIKNLTKQDDKLLRTVKNYQEDCNLNNPSVTGIAESCIFNQVIGFHVILCIILDIMHDILEGAANYTMVNILNDLIYNQNSFSLDFLNQRIECFQYGHLEGSNKIPIIEKKHIQSKKKLKMSASEMLCFVRYFSLLVGDRVKENNNVWSLYILLRKIVAIVTSPRMVAGHICQLDILIPQFLCLYKLLYGPLKYKFHNLSHLRDILRNNGPAVHYWSMRFESKHRPHKLTAVNTSNKINILKTVSVKSQLQLAYLKAVKKFKFDELVYETYENIDERSRRMYFPNSNQDEKIISTEHAHTKGINYEVNMVFVMEMGDNDLLEFGKITEIFVKDDEIYLLMQPLISISFNEHFYAYNVESRNVLKLKKSSELPDIHPCLLVEMDKRLVIATRYIL